MAKIWILWKLIDRKHGKTRVEQKLVCTLMILLAITIVLSIFCLRNEEKILIKMFFCALEILVFWQYQMMHTLLMFIGTKL